MYINFCFCIYNKIFHFIVLTYIFYWGSTQFYILGLTHSDYIELTHSHFIGYEIASFLRIVEKHLCFVKGRGHAVAGKETLKYLQVLRMSIRFSLTSPCYCQCGEPWHSQSVFIGLTYQVCQNIQSN